VTEPQHIGISPDDPAFDVAEFDPSVSPREDFYRFVNGGWIDANPVPAEYGAWGAFQELHERNQGILREILDDVASRDDIEPGMLEHWVGTYYRSGMDTERIEALGTEPLEPWLSRISAIASLEDVADMLVSMHRSAIDALFDFAVMPDFDDAEAHLFYLGQSGLGLPDRDYYLRDDETSLQLLGDYRGHVQNMFELLGERDPASAATSVLTIERSIADLSYTNVQMRDVELVTNKYLIEDVDGLMPRFGLHRYLEAMGAGSEVAVNIDNEGFYPGIDLLLTETSIDEWKAYLTWNVVRSFASSLPEPFERESFDFYGRKLGGQQEQKARWKRVLAAGSGDIGQLIAQLYVRDNFPPRAKERMEHLVERLFDAMRATLEEITWMGPETKRQALEKLDGFGSKIGYPDQWRDYSALQLTEGAWLENRLACRRFEITRQLAKLGAPVDPHEWSIAPHIVNAYYSPLRNEIVFPAGILQHPFFNLDADPAVNYGAIGAVIGHEITHGFDDQGSRFDAAGNVRNWWTDEDRAEFDARAAVMVEQFSAYEIEDGLFVNGELTLGENIADLGGLRIALRALDAELGDDTEPIAGLTPHQRFFISWARVWRRNYTDEYLRLLVNSDPHSPSNLRCNGPMGNLIPFADAFGIPHDDRMIRPLADRVDIW
jgi:putative endopeptidase